MFVPLKHSQPPVDLNATSSNFFKGCLELLSLNEELVSLYNFEETFQMNTNTDVPCSRSEGFYLFIEGYNLLTLCESAFLIKSLHVLKQEEAIQYAWMDSWWSVFWWIRLCGGFVRNSEGRPCVWAECQTHLAKRHSAVVPKRRETSCLLYDSWILDMLSWVNVLFLRRLSLLRISTWLWLCMTAFWKYSITLRERCPSLPTNKSPKKSTMLRPNLWVKSSYLFLSIHARCNELYFLFFVFLVGCYLSTF